jgi:uncharacterized membrane protein
MIEVLQMIMYFLCIVTAVLLVVAFIVGMFQIDNTMKDLNKHHAEYIRLSKERINQEYAKLKIKDRFLQ